MQKSSTKYQQIETINVLKELHTTTKSHINIVNWSLTKEQREYNGAKIVFSMNGAGTTGYPHAKKKKESRHRLYTFHKN